MYKRFFFSITVFVVAFACVASANTSSELTEGVFVDETYEQPKLEQEFLEEALNELQDEDILETTEEITNETTTEELTQDLSVFENFLTENPDGDTSGETSGGEQVGEEQNFETNASKENNETNKDEQVESETQTIEIESQENEQEINEGIEANSEDEIEYFEELLDDSNESSETSETSESLDSNREQNVLSREEILFFDEEEFEDEDYEEPDDPLEYDEDEELEEPMTKEAFAEYQAMIASLPQRTLFNELDIADDELNDTEICSFPEAEYGIEAGEDIRIDIEFFDSQISENNLSFGDFPAGIELNVDDIQGTTVTIEIESFEDSQKGSFTIPLLHTDEQAFTYVCQIPVQNI